ncbi:bifunctional diaminohydroxyphosphoribosylaminopyrimidine deaminase/5-amino-6-(5-phosphoribosylamino)uracil reductase RibD [bacterium]|nr:bifunctional diaminohydroxyphosphoribosylaminopyrimidine deaminase/5-amino-6-(5-phosphoribosylamino)uracil reductase RibD [bacterium]
MINEDVKFMKLVLALAKKGEGYTSPNPMVGALIVKNGQIVGKGYHAYSGANHAEVCAIEDAGRKARNGTLYVNLEPCAHTNKKTPPCVPAIVKSGLSRVVIGMRDPNPLVNGKGIRALEKTNIQVVCGVMEEQAKELNKVYAKHITTGLPFVTVKYAMSIDGKIATRTGDSKWISNDKSRRFVHRLRSISDSVLVGLNTVINDDPRLTPRSGSITDKMPIRIVLDSRARIPTKSRILDTVGAGLKPARTIIAVTKNAPNSNVEKLKQMGVEIICCESDKNNMINIPDLLGKLGKKGITSILVEGGSKVMSSFVEKRAVERIYAFIGPKIIGGNEAPVPFVNNGVNKIKDAVSLNNIKARRFEDDIMIEGYPNW